MRFSRWVVRAPRTTRAAVGGGLVGLWALVLAVLFALSLDLPVVLPVAIAVLVAALAGVLLLAVDASGRRAAARRVGWTGSPDYYALVRVDADHGVLPDVEPARELAYRYARLSWGRRWVTWTLAVVMGVTQLGAAVLFAVVDLSGYLGSIAGYLTLAAIFAYPAVVVLPRHRRVIRAVEGR